MVQDMYKPCSCGSGKKLKFCCQQKVAGRSPKDLIRQAAMFPVYETGIIESWKENGLASIYVVRQQPNLKYLYGVYIVDYYCLGLKNTFSNANAPWSLVETLKRKMAKDFSYVEFPYEDARSMILGGIAYAAKLGFRPQEDWNDSRHIVEDGREYNAKFEFGRNGKPYYIQGPEDDVRAIGHKLRSHQHHAVIELRP